MFITVFSTNKINYSQVDWLDIKFRLRFGFKAHKFGIFGQVSQKI